VLRDAAGAAGNIYLTRTTYTLLLALMIERLESMLAAGNDSAMLRFSLGNAYQKSDRGVALVHLRRAVELDPDYSAAWKLLGQTLAAENDLESAAITYRRGIEVAQAQGDMQVVRELQVFLKRTEKLIVQSNQD